MTSRARMLLWVTGYQLLACWCLVSGRDPAGFFCLFAAVITVLIAIHDAISTYRVPHASDGFHIQPPRAWPRAAGTNPDPPGSSAKRPPPSSPPLTACATVDPDSCGRGGCVFCRHMREKKAAARHEGSEEQQGFAGAAR